MNFCYAVDDAVSLRLFEPHHADEVYAVVDANRQHLGRWLPWVATTTEPADLQTFAQRMLEARAAGTGLAMSILEHGRVVGGVGLQITRRTDVQMAVADIGYWLAADAQGRGIMTRAVRAVTSHAFDAMELLRLTIRAEPDNAGSCGVPRRLGWRHEGTLRGVCYWNDRRVDHELFAILKDEWSERHHASQIHR